MKLSHSSYVALPLFIALVGGCASSPIARIDDNRGKYESWPLEVQEAVLKGQARAGMTPEQVEMALGKPSEIVSRSVRAGEDEVWVYRKSAVGSTILNNTGVSVGTGVGGIVAPLLFGVLIDTGSRASVFWGYLLGSALMIISGWIALRWGVDAERKPLEEVARPLTFVGVE